MARLGRGDRKYTMKKQTLTDFKNFSEHLVDLYNEGLSENEISAMYRGTLVEWRGQITSMSLDEKYARGLTMNPGLGLLPMKDGWEFRTDHIALNVADENVERWRDCQVGDCVSFKAKIPQKAVPFPEIQFLASNERPLVVLMLGLVSCELLEVITSTTSGG